MEILVNTLIKIKNLRKNLTFSIWENKNEQNFDLINVPYSRKLSAKIKISYKNATSRNKFINEKNLSKKDIRVCILKIPNNKYPRN